MHPLGERSGFVIVRCGEGATHRRLPIPAPTARMLREYPGALQGVGPNDPPWVGQRGPLTTESGLHRLLAKYARRAAYLPSAPMLCATPSPSATRRTIPATCGVWPPF